MRVVVVVVVVVVAGGGRGVEHALASCVCDCHAVQTASCPKVLAYFENIQLIGPRDRFRSRQVHGSNQGIGGRAGECEQKHQRDGYEERSTQRGALYDVVVLHSSA